MRISKEMYKWSDNDSISSLTHQSSIRDNRFEKAHVKSTIELPCGRTHVGVCPMLTIRRSRSAAHLISTSPLPSVTWEPHKLALKSPARIILSIRDDKASDNSLRKILYSRKPIFGEMYVDMTR